MSIHIGQNIKLVVEQHGISKAEMGRRLNMSPTNVHKIFKRDTIDTGLLLKISTILQHNFFQPYIELFPPQPLDANLPSENPTNEIALLHELLKTKDELIKALQQNSLK